MAGTRFGIIGEVAGRVLERAAHVYGSEVRLDAESSMLIRSASLIC
jgi:hypothetical protein